MKVGRRKSDDGVDNLNSNSRCINEYNCASYLFFPTSYYFLKNGSDKKLKIPSKITLRVHFVRCIEEKKKEKIV